jgi:hypothetical protein
VCVYMATKLASVETQLGLLLRTIFVFCCQSCCLRCVVGALAGSATLRGPRGDKVLHLFVGPVRPLIRMT